jgi:hypothetical protein
VSEPQPPWDPFGQQDPRQDQYPPQQPGYRQQQDPGQDQGQSPYPPQQPYGPPPPQPPFTPGPQYRAPPGQPPYQGQPQQPSPQGQPPYGQQPPPGAPPGRRSRQSWPQRHKVLTILGGVFGFFVVIAAISAAAHGSTSTKTVTEPGPRVTVTQAAPTVTVTKTVTKRVTATRTVIPTSDAQGEATQISADGVYVVGQDIPGGTWHTSGGGQCYEATLSGTDTINDIIDNNNFTGPDTVSLAGAKAFDINGGCTWQHEG